MFDQLFKIWFSEFGSREITTGGLMRGSVPLREILLRLAPDPNDRHSISSKHLGLLLAKHKGIAREGHRLEGRFVHKQWHWKLTEAPIDAIPVLPSPTRTSPSLVPPSAQPARPSLPPIDPELSPRDALSAALIRAQNCLGDAIRAQDAGLMRAAQDHLQTTVEAVKSYFGAGDRWRYYFKQQRQ